MAQDMQWPSEEEDFDAVSTPENTVPVETKTVTLPKPTKAAKPISKPETVVKPAKPVSVAVSEPEEVDPVEAAFAEDEDGEYQDRPAASQEPEQRPISVQADEEPEQNNPIEEAPLSEEQPPQVNENPPKEPKIKQPRQPRDGSGIARTVFEVVLVVALIAVGYFAYGLNQDKKDLKAEVTKLNSNPQIAIQKQTDDLIKQVGALINLPQGEAPTVANVSDAAKAREQSSFFANAQNGDKVLMYVKAGEAILYRPSTNKIILVAPLTFNNNTTQAAPQGTSTTKR